jgi:uncharacterized membrane protein
LNENLCRTGADASIVSDTVRVRRYVNFQKAKIQLIVIYNKFIYKINLKNRNSIIKKLKVNSMLEVNIYKLKHTITNAKRLV